MENLLNQTDVGSCHLKAATCRLQSASCFLYYSGPICVGTMSFGERDVLMIGGESKR